MSNKLKSSKAPNRFDSIIADLDRANGYPSTKHQLDIYRAINSRDAGNILVEGVAGSSKSTTIRNSLQFLPAWSKNIILAFNLHIANAMKASGLPSHTTAGTLNSVCFRAVLGARGKDLPKPTMEKWKTYDILRAVTKRAEDKIVEEIAEQSRILRAAATANNNAAVEEEYAILTQLELKERALVDCASPIAKIVSLLKGQSLGGADEESILYLVDRFGVDWNPVWLPLVIETYETSMDQREIMDFDDQLLFSMDDACKFEQFDNIFVDESQDLNQLNLDIIAKMARLGTKNPARVIFVGDRNQSIYGFRGADPRAIAEIRDRFQTKCLPLNVSWRCGKNIIKAAQIIVPQIEAAPNAVDGEIISIMQADFASTVQDGDYVLCRITSPLISQCLRLLAKGRKAVVLGREIGASLTAVLKKFETPEYDGLELMDKITYYQQLELGRIAGNDVRSQSKVTMIVDKCDALRAICEECSTIPQARIKIDMIFADQSTRGITFSTIHKAKGLEADRIFIIRPDLMPLPQAKLEWEREQEMNLVYVATTRARHSLFYVTQPKPSKHEGKSSSDVHTGRRDDNPQADTRF